MVTPKAQVTKTKIGRWNHIKIKSFCTVKATIHRGKEQPTEWEKIFVNDISDKVSMSKIK